MIKLTVTIIVTGKYNETETVTETGKSELVNTLEK
jgi:hypothetical protein